MRDLLERQAGELTFLDLELPEISQGVVALPLFQPAQLVEHGPQVGVLAIDAVGSNACLDSLRSIGSEGVDTEAINWRIAHRLAGELCPTIGVRMVVDCDQRSNRARMLTGPLDRHLTHSSNRRASWRRLLPELPTRSQRPQGCSRHP